MRGFTLAVLVVLAVLSACLVAAETEVENVAEKAPALEETPPHEAYGDDLQERTLEEEDMQEFDENELDERSAGEEELEERSVDDDTELEERSVDDDTELEERSAFDDELEEHDAEDNELEEQNVDEEDEALLENSANDDEMEERSIEDMNNIDVQNVHKRWVCYHHAGCYRVFTCHYPWLSARHVCRRYGGRLASIHNRRQNHVVAAFARHYGNLWIGLNDRHRERCFRWSDGSRYHYRRWQCHEPNNYRNEDCVEMYRNGHWNDLACRNRRRFVCTRWHRHHHYHHHHHRHHHHRYRPCWG